MADYPDDGSYEVDSFPENDGEDYQQYNSSADLGAPPGAGMQDPMYAGPANSVDIYGGGVEMGDDQFSDNYGEREQFYNDNNAPNVDPYQDGRGVDGNLVPEAMEDQHYNNATAPPPPAALGAAGDVDRGQFPEDYIEAFQIYDKEYGDDAISAAMLGTVLRALGQNPTEGQLAELVQTMGKDIYTVADVDFILRNYDLRDQCSGTEIKDMWEMVAGPGQTFVQKSVLQALLSKVGDKIFEQDFAKIMMAADVGGDVVTFDQFERIMTH